LRGEERKRESCAIGDLRRSIKVTLLREPKPARARRSGKKNAQKIANTTGIIKMRGRHLGK